MRGAFVGTIGAVAILVSVAALIEHDQREGPLDPTLDAVALDVRATGTYHARPFNEPVLGLCPEEPCTPQTDIDLRIQGLPQLDYTARLDDGSTASCPTGPSCTRVALRQDGEAYRVRLNDGDHTDKQRLVISLAGRDIAAFRVGPSSDPTAYDDTVAASWQVDSTRVRLTEIGGVTISTVAKASIGQVPPDGWEFHAVLQGEGGQVDLGAMHTVAARSVLDARVERVPLEDQDRIIIDLRPSGSATQGFPLLDARL